jgi:NADH:ubiquinone oxidoreductase subunit 2 (subunit N)
LYLYNVQLLFMFLIFHLSETSILDRRKYLNLLVLIFIISYSGIPPIIGFFMKLQILNFFFFFYQRVIFLILIAIIIIPSTFFIIYYRMNLFLNKKLFIFQHISLFYTISILIFFLLPSFYILM